MYTVKFYSYSIEHKLWNPIRKNHILKMIYPLHKRDNLRMFKHWGGFFKLYSLCLKLVIYNLYN